MTAFWRQSGAAFRPASTNRQQSRAVQLINRCGRCLISSWRNEADTMTSVSTQATTTNRPPRPSDADIDIYGLTHPGKVRPNNEDHFLVCALQRRTEVFCTSLPNPASLGGNGRIAMLGMVADGVGGAVAGEEASRLALEGITRYVSQALRCYYSADPSDDDEFIHTLEDAALKVHNELAEMTREHTELRGMATTLTLWLGVWPNAYVLQVGDSRCYTLKDGQLTQLSRDQTMAEDLVEQGVFTRADAQHTKWAHVLSSAIGGPQAAPVVRRFQQGWGQVGLMCSDGLTRHVSDERIREILMATKTA